MRSSAKIFYYGVGLRNFSSWGVAKPRIVPHIGQHARKVHKQRLLRFGPMLYRFEKLAKVK